MTGRASGFRGYIGSRSVLGHRTGQHIQNLVIRDYAERRRLLFKLSATEYAMAHCYMMLDQVVGELPAHQGIILYSMFMLPQRAERRQAVYRRVLEAGCSLHGAAEDIVLATEADIRRWEDIWLVQRTVAGIDYVDVLNGAG